MPYSDKGPGDATSLGALDCALLDTETGGEAKAVNEEPQVMRRVVRAPYDVEIEQALLGAILVDNSAMERLAGLKPDDFYDPLHQRIYEAMLQSKAQGHETLTPLTLRAVMAHDSALREVGGHDYLVRLVQAAPALPNIRDFTMVIRDLATRRALIGLGTDITEGVMIAPLSLPVAALIDEFDKALKAVRDKALASASHRIQLIGFDDITLSVAGRELVSGLIPMDALTLAWGPPKCGKSFFALDLSMHVALGWEYRGRRVQRGTVVYCAFEGQTGVKKRVAAFRKKFLVGYDQTIPFYLQPLRLDLVSDHAELIEAIKRAPADAPVLVVLDTLNRSITGSESDDRDMSAYIKAADAIREAFGCAVLIVHHCGLDGSRPRGHTSLPGAVGAQIAVKCDANDNIVAEVELMKDGPTGEQIVSRLHIVEVGIDEDGQPVTSCVVLPSEVPAKAEQGARLTPGETGWFRDLVALFAEPDATHCARPRADMAEVHCMTKKAVREGFKRKGRFTLDDDGNLKGSDREKLSKALNALKDKGKICMTDEYVWLLEDRQ